MFTLDNLSSIWVGKFLTQNWILFLVLSCAPIIYWFSTRNFSYWSKRGVPSPPKIPFLGNFFSLFTPLPLLYQKYVKSYGKILGLYQGQNPVLLISDPELIRRIWVKDFHLFRNRVGLPRNKISSQNLIAARNEEWKRIRSILTPIFTSLKLKKMESTMEACVQTMIESFDQMTENGNNFDARAKMDNFTMDVIAKCAFATDTNAHHDQDNVFVRSAKNLLAFKLLRFLALNLVPGFLAKRMLAMKAPPLHRPEFDFFETLSRHLIKERRETKDLKNDMLQLMVNAEHNSENLTKTLQEDLKNAQDGHHVNLGRDELDKQQRELKDIIGSKYLSEEEIMAQAIVFFLAGYDTTASTLSYCLFELAINPDIQERLYKQIQKAKSTDPNLSYTTLVNLDYLDAVISETLRKYPPAWLLNREANEQYYIPEYKLTLEKGQAVNVPVYAIHHSEEYFPEPEKFDPERFMPENRDKIVPYSYLPFGGGPRNCIGMRFALTEAKMGLAKMLDHFQFVRTDKTSNKLSILPGFFLLKTSQINLGVRKRVKLICDSVVQFSSDIQFN